MDKKPLQSIEGKQIQATLKNGGFVVGELEFYNLSNKTVFLIEATRTDIDGVRTHKAFMILNSDEWKTIEVE